MWVCVYSWVCVCVRRRRRRRRMRSEKKGTNKINYGEKNKVTEFAIRSSADARAPTKSRCVWAWEEQGQSVKNKIELCECVRAWGGGRGARRRRQVNYGETNKWLKLRFDRTPTREFQQKVDVTESKRTGKSEKNRNEVPVFVRAEGGGGRREGGGVN